MDYSLATKRALGLVLSFLADKAKREHHMLHGSGCGQTMLTSSAGESKLVLALSLTRNLLRNQVATSPTCIEPASLSPKSPNK